MKVQIAPPYTQQPRRDLMDAKEQEIDKLTLMVVEALWIRPRAAGDLLVTLGEQLKSVEDVCSRCSRDIRYNLQLKIQDLKAAGFIYTTPAPRERLRLTRKSRNFFWQTFRGERQQKEVREAA
jgi:hypothetical protein